MTRQTAATAAARRPAPAPFPRARRCCRSAAWALAWACAATIVASPAVVPAQSWPWPGQAVAAATQWAVHAPVAEDADSSAPGSRGTSHHGSLVGGVELPEQAPGMQRLRVVRERDTGWGSPTLVALVLRVSARLGALPHHVDNPLRVGNMSLRGGGAMRWSHSHRAGRDVDFALYALDSRGHAAQPSHFVSFDDEGLGWSKGRRLRFDAGRTWDLIDALLREGGPDLARLYLATSLREQVLAHARAHGADAALLTKAEAMLEEPSHAGRHDDHLHVRLLCQELEIAAGCVDEDARWPWSRDVRAAQQAVVDRAAAQLAQAPERRRMAAVAALADWVPFDGEACRGVAWTASWDAAAAVREVARAALAAHGAGCATAMLLGAARAQPDRQRAEELTLLAVRLATEEDTGRLTTLLEDHPEGYVVAWRSTFRSHVRAVAARALTRLRGYEAREALAHVLGDAAAPARRAALIALRAIAHRPFAGADDARRWLRSEPTPAPRRWLVEGLAQQWSIPVELPAVVGVPGLLELLRHPHRLVGESAERALELLADGTTLQHLDTPRHRHRAWLRWWRSHEARFGEKTLASLVEEPAPAVVDGAPSFAAVPPPEDARDGAAAPRGASAPPMAP